MAAAALCRFLNVLALAFLLHAFLVCSLSFDLPSIGPNDTKVRIKVEGDASITTQGIQLTPYESKLGLNKKAGRAKYVQLFHLWNKATRDMADFTTNFTFNINSNGSSSFADGVAFFVANFSKPFNKTATFGGGLGLMDTALKTSPEPFVAVAFDTFSNDENIPKTSVSININSWNQSCNSTNWQNSVTEGMDNNASITYHASSKVLQVVFTGFLDGYYQTDSVSCEVDMRDYLPEHVSIGFSGATGYFFEKNTVNSWQFDSTPPRPVISVSASPAPSPSMETPIVPTPSPSKGTPLVPTPSPSKGAPLLVPAPSPSKGTHSVPAPAPAPITQNLNNTHTVNPEEKNKKKKGPVIAGVSIGVLILLALLALAMYTCFKKTRAAKGKNMASNRVE